ncbi:MAG: hypothetical protein IPN49_18720 [Saprospiraceae bacterium]|nr:hypothetical protein [Saprospiraceae bacterium]
MRTVDSIYALAPQNIRDNGGNGLPKYKHWRRWAWYMERRLDEKGQFVNIGKRNLELAEEKQKVKKSGSNRSYLPGDWKPIGMEESSHSADSLINYGIGNTGNSYANGTGRVDRIAFHPTDPNTFYVGAPMAASGKQQMAVKNGNALQIQYLPLVFPA